MTHPRREPPPSAPPVPTPLISRRALLAAPALISAASLSACSDDRPDRSIGATAGSGGPDELFPEPASFEIIAGIPQRVMVGISTRDGRILHGGTVSFAFAPVTDDAAKSDPQFRSDAIFLPVPRSTPPPPSIAIGEASAGIGVYQSIDVVFPSAGFYILKIDVPLGDPQRLETAVEVVERAQVPSPGDPAPKTDNPTQASADVPLEAIDSRSGPAGLTDLADPLLHRESIADVLSAGRPCVVIVSTPAFCVSKFCGPLTDIVNDLAAEAQRANSDVGFVHLEVWRSFERSEVNRSAADWIMRNGAEGREPWIFLIDRRGRIAARWDNLVAEADLRAAIASL